jgi:GNAT superfamily N-acetyltransferase
VFLELDPRDFKDILPLYARAGMIFPLILAVVQRRQRGQVFVDDSTNPKSALIVNKSGFMQFVGTEVVDDRLISFLQSPTKSMPAYLLWYAPPLQIQKILDGLPYELVRRRERVRFTFHAKNIIDPVICPTGFTVQPLKQELIEKAGHFKLDIESRFWASAADFIEHGIGTCVIKDGEVVSLCYSACIAADFAEIDIITQAEYRGMGLAGIAARAFVAECLRRGIKPTWDCFIQNTPSLRLANSLGFTQSFVYPFYSFNVPLHVSVINTEAHPSSPSSTEADL